MQLYYHLILELAYSLDYLLETVTEMSVALLILEDVNKASVRLSRVYCTKLPSGETWTLYPFGKVDGGRMISVGASILGSDLNCSLKVVVPSEKPKLVGVPAIAAGYARL